jgi:hypothetical protein
MSTLLGTARLHSSAASKQNQHSSIRDAWPCIAILFAFFLAGIHAARVRPFWFDELSTLFMVDTPTIREMFRAIPTDGNPPLYLRRRATQASMASGRLRNRRKSAKTVT